MTDTPDTITLPVNDMAALIVRCAIQLASLSIRQLARDAKGLTEEKSKPRRGRKAATMAATRVATKVETRAAAAPKAEHRPICNCWRCQGLEKDPYEDDGELEEVPHAAE